MSYFLENKELDPFSKKRKLMIEITPSADCDFSEVLDGIFLSVDIQEHSPWRIVMFWNKGDFFRVAKKPARNQHNLTNYCMNELEGGNCDNLFLDIWFKRITQVIL